MEAPSADAVYEPSEHPRRLLRPTSTNSAETTLSPSAGSATLGCHRATPSLRPKWATRMSYPTIRSNRHRDRARAASRRPAAHSHDLTRRAASLPQQGRASHPSVPYGGGESGTSKASPARSASPVTLRLLPRRCRLIIARRVCQGRRTRGVRCGIIRLRHEHGRYEAMAPIVASIEIARRPEEVVLVRDRPPRA